MTAGERAAEAARALVGCRFRLHGRDSARGLDCVGLAAVALRAAGPLGPVPQGYRLRSGNADAVAAMISHAGLRLAEGQTPGDLVLVRAGPGQLHLLIRTEAGFVHADAGAGRVVERPGDPPWPIVGCWRTTGEGDGDGDAGTDGSGRCDRRADRGGGRRRAGAIGRP